MCAKVAAAVASDSAAPMKIASAAALAQVTGALGLPLSVAETSGRATVTVIPPFPMLAPFAGMVPKLLQLTGRCVP